MNEEEPLGINSFFVLNVMEGAVLVQTDVHRGLRIRGWPVEVLLVISCNKAVLIRQQQAQVVW